MGLIWHDGQLEPEENIVLRHDDRSFLYGDGIFETLRTCKGGLLQAREHARRMRASAEVLGFCGCPDEDELVRIMTSTAEANMGGHDGELYLRATLSRGVGYGPDITRDYTAHLLVYARPLPPSDPERYEKGIKAVFSSEKRPACGSLFRHKSTSYLSCLLARREATAARAAEALICDTDGAVLEGACSNLFMIRDGTLQTAPETANLLPGITREAVMVLAGKEDLSVIEEKFTVDTLLQADEIFLTNSIQGILPVVSIDSHIIGKGTPGTATSMLMDAYRHFIGID